MNFLVVEALELQEELTLKEIAEIVQIKTIQPLVKALIEKKSSHCYRRIKVEIQTEISDLC